MNKRIMKAINEIEAIRIAMGKEYQWENIEGEMIPYWQYYTADDEDNEGVPKERAISDRKKMLDILQKFYNEYAHDFDGMDDFVTLFGVYCNHYILFNLHQAISDNNFGIEYLWPSINDATIQKYLHLIQQGIFKGINDGYEDFLDANNLLSSKYSLPNLYLFIYSMQRVNIIDKEDKNHLENKIMNYYRSMSRDLRNYIMSTGDFIKDEEDDFFPGNPNALPYISFRNPKEHHTFLLSKKLANALSTIKNSNNPNSFNFKLAHNNINEAIQGMIDNITDNNENDGMLECAPMSWRDDDGIIYRQAFLSIPAYVNWSDDPAWLFNYAIIAKSEKEQTINEKDEIIKDFTHTYQNMEATQLYKLAKTLLSKESPEDRQLGRTALLEYTRKISLTKDVYMMKLKFEHNTKLLQEIIHNSCSEPNGDTHNIQDIINQSLSTCLISAFYDPGTEKARSMRKNMKQLWQDINLKTINFEKEVIYNDDNCIKWLHKNGFIINIETNTLWDRLYFISNGYAEIFLRNILTEFFINLLKYGNIKKNATLQFQGDADFIEIKMTNQMPNEKSLSSNSKIGINAIGKTLHVLWGDERDSKIDRITTNCKNNIFTTSISLPTNIFNKEAPL